MLCRDVDERLVLLGVTDIVQQVKIYGMLV
jgi:hypothetical protein